MLARIAPYSPPIRLGELFDIVQIDSNLVSVGWELQFLTGFGAGEAITEKCVISQCWRKRPLCRDKRKSRKRFSLVLLLPTSMVMATGNSEANFQSAAWFEHATWEIPRKLPVTAGVKY